MQHHILFQHIPPKRTQTPARRRLSSAVLKYLEPKSKNPGETFRERTMRLIVGIALVFFSMIFILEAHKGYNSVSFVWYTIIYAISITVLFALHQGAVRLASRLMVFSVLLVVIDPAARYWAPGTILFGMLFTFMFHMILENPREVAAAVCINLAAYVFTMLRFPDPAPLPHYDYYATPLMAVFTTFVAHSILSGIAFLIRREQAERDRAALVAEQQRTDILREMLNSTSHDLRTPLARINMKLYFIERALPEDARHHVNDIKAAINDVDQMISTMMELTRLDEIKEYPLESVTLAAVFADLAADYKIPTDRKQIQFVCEAPDANLFVSANAADLRRAIANLLDNALAFTPEQGRIIMQSERQSAQILMRVSDTGSGIAPEHLRLIFNRFYRADEARNQSTGRNGLGLAISKRIIELHGGHINVESIVGVGSTFTIVLPVPRSPQQP